MEEKKILTLEELEKAVGGAVSPDFLAHANREDLVNMYAEKYGGRDRIPSTIMQWLESMKPDLKDVIPTTFKKA